MSLKIIQKNIKTITVSANKLNMLIHTTGVLVLEHALEHGDCSTAKDLVNAMPASMRRTMLQLWFETYSPVRFQMKDGLAVKVGMLKDTAKGYKPFDIDAARETPFFTLAEANPEGKQLSLEAILGFIKSQIKKIDKSVEEGTAKPEDIASLKAASITLSGLKLVRVDGQPVPEAPAEADGEDVVVEDNLGLDGTSGIGLRAVA